MFLIRWSTGAVFAVIFSNMIQFLTKQEIRYRRGVAITRRVGVRLTLCMFTGLGTLSL
jgi:hypothetical protein